MEFENPERWQEDFLGKPFEVRFKTDGYLLIYEDIGYRFGVTGPAIGMTIYHLPSSIISPKSKSAGVYCSNNEDKEHIRKLAEYLADSAYRIRRTEPITLKGILTGIHRDNTEENMILTNCLPNW